MEELALQFFPYPHVFRGERRAGTLSDWPAICESCNRQCESAPKTEGLALCSYGLNYQRIDDDVVVAGIAVRDFNQQTPARRKRLRELGKQAIARVDLERVLERAQATNQRLADELRSRQDQAVADFRDSKAYYDEIIDALRPEMERALGQVHDYKQFVQQIVQNMNVIFEARHPGESTENKLDKANKQEKAIYYAAIAMDEKLDAMLFLESPERIREPREQGRMRLHGQVFKYVSIYASRSDLKGVEVRLVGESWGTVVGNTRALAIIPHTLIDNAIKYAPRGTLVKVELMDTETAVRLKVESYGPKIEEDEMVKIFDPFFRARAARAASSEGMGFGLASAQNIARAHGTEITVEQGPREQLGLYLTTFAVSFKAA